jgi:hypothetical protein
MSLIHIVCLTIKSLYVLIDEVEIIYLLDCEISFASILINTKCTEQFLILSLMILLTYLQG